MLSSTQPQVVTEHLETPLLDDRKYRVILLQNKLEALLVHDPDTDKASASVSVDTGSFSDADDMPGMAHAVEHLLFMGTEKYPVENQYNQYLSAHSGYSNAYTAPTQTNYYIEIAASADPDSRALTNGHTLSPLHGALDRFAQFFISPLFLASTLDRELRAVDSENKKNLQSDGWRLRQLDHTLSNPKHPFHHFSTGNLETLRDEPRKRGVDIRQAFIDFHRRHYSANRSKLVVLGRESLDELEKWVGEMFAHVGNKDLAQNRWDGVQPYTKEQLGTVIFAKPVMDSRSLELSFPFLDELEDQALYDVQPGRYISHLIGHEGPGSILAYLKAEGLANSLSAGASTVCPGVAFLHITVRLTEAGLGRYKEVTEVIFQYISLLKESGPLAWIMDEIKTMADVDFRYREKTPASSFASSMSSIMQNSFPRERLLSGMAVVRRFDADVIEKALSYIRSDNFRLTVVSQTFPGDWNLREKWYGTEYKVERFEPEFVSALDKASRMSSKTRIAQLHLPHRNEFIPTNLEVEKKETAVPMKAPKLIRNDNRIRTWWKKDETFWVPRGAVAILLRNPLGNATPACAIKTRMFCELVKDSLNEYSYDADISGLEYGLGAVPLGIEIEISGYNDKMAVLLEKVLIGMRDLDAKLDRFDIMKERLLRGLRNYDFQQPFRQVGDFTNSLVAAHSWIVEQYIPELESLTLNELKDFFPQLLRQLHAEVLCHGNIYHEDALKISDLIQSTFQYRPLPLSQWPVRRNMMIPPGSSFTHRRQIGDPANVNNCIEYYLAVGPATDKSLRAKLLLLTQFTEEAGFDQLRTKEQLGYVVWTGPRINSTTVGYKVIIQSEKPTEYLEDRINAFLALFAKTLDSMSSEELESHKRSLINKRLEKTKNLDQETARTWGYIANEFFDFSQREQEAEHIRRLGKEQMIEFYQHYIAPTSPYRAKLSVHLQAQVTPGALVDQLSLDDTDEQVAEGLIGEQVVEALDQFNKTQGIEADPAEIGAIFADLKFTKVGPKPIIKAFENFLSKKLATSPDRLKAAINQANEFLGLILPRLGVVNSQEEEAGDNTESGAAALPPVPPVKEITYVDDVHKYKSSLTISAGARPVVDLSTFEDFDSKL